MLEHVYSASGNKLAKKLNGSFTQFYCGSVVYKGDMSPEYVATSEGLALYDGSQYAYQYNLTDHLGNVRAVADASGSVVQSTDYYPFGLAHALSSLDKNKYLYNGKEIQDEVLGGTSFGMLDYGARFYDPTIGRWHSVDPLAEKNTLFSPYTYVLNNPLRLIDPDGRDWRDFLNGAQNGFVGRFQAIGYAVSHPVETAQNVLNQQPSSVGEAFMNAADMLTMGSVSGSIDFAKAVVADVNGGDGSATGQVLGGLAADAAIAVVSEKVGSHLLSKNAGVIVRNGGDNVASMNIVREIRHGEKIVDLISTAQSRTLSTGVEHAIVRLGENSVAPGARVLVSGGKDGISFRPKEIKTLFGHTHPYQTGASAGDKQALKILDQSKQYIFEGFNPKPIILRK